MSTKNIFFLIQAFLLLTACEFSMSSKKFSVEKEIMEKDIYIEFPKNERPEGFTLKLKNEMECNIQLDIFDKPQDSLVLMYTIAIEELRDQNFSVDWYSRYIIVKLNNSSSLACDTLDLELLVSFWRD